jgi:hypothetical protein
MTKDDWSAVIMTVTVALVGLGLATYMYAEQAKTKGKPQLEENKND